MEIIKDIENDQIIFTINGSLSLPNIATIHQEINEHAATFDQITIKGEASDMDLSFVQLVYSLMKNKQVNLKLELNEDQASIFEIAGIKIFNL